VTLSSRLGDYGITGALFIVAQMIGFVATDPGGSEQRARDVLKYLDAMTSAAPSLSTSLASLLTVLALILVFFVGLVIDLLGFYAPSVEVVSFRRRLAMHDHWLRPLLATHADFLGADVKRLIDEYHPAPSTVTALKETFTALPFSKRYWRIAARNWRSVRVIGAYQRLLSFMVTLALRNAGPSSAEVLRDQLGLWRTSRAIATALVFLAIEVIVLRGFATNGLESYWRIQIIYLACSVLAIALCVRSFHQVCETVFAALYIGNQSKTQQEQLRGQSTGAI
jgi:hypothetical protein